MPNSLHLLHTKSWHVGKAENIAKVKRDEAIKEQEDLSKRAEDDKVLSKLRLDRLRKRAREEDGLTRDVVNNEDFSGQVVRPSQLGEREQVKITKSVQSLPEGRSLVDSYTRNPWYSRIERIQAKTSNSSLNSLSQRSGILSSTPRVIDTAQLSRASRDASIKHREDPMTAVRKALAEKRSSMGLPSR
jgi:hypothetical protein